jgi:predicted GNAT family acetyltransferase
MSRCAVESTSKPDKEPHVARKEQVEVTVIDNPSEHRFEGYVDGTLAGFVVYESQPEGLALVHTEVDDEFEGQGVGSALAAGVLDEIRRRGIVIVARCPFVSRYISRHPEYGDLVAPTG